MKLSSKFSGKTGSTSSYTPTDSGVGGNFFGKQNIFENASNMTFQQKEEKPLPEKRLDDLDSNLIKKTGLERINNEPLRIEMKLQNKEKMVKEIDEHIEILKLLDDGRKKDIELLEKRKKELKKEIAEYKKKYRALGLSYKVTDICLDFFTGIKEFFKNIIKHIQQSEAFKLFARLNPALSKKLETEQMVLKMKAIQYGIARVKITDYAGNKGTEESLQNFSTLVTKFNQFDARAEKLLKSAKSSHHLPVNRVSGI